MGGNNRKADVHYQERACDFKVGDTVYPVLTGNPHYAGTVVAVWPAIGMVDVAFPYGSTRYPVEELFIGKNSPERIPTHDPVPGGATVSVSGGPCPQRVASKFVKQAVYWAGKNRQYRPTKQELASGKYCCPRCEEAILRNVVYKKEDGKSVKLFCCPECLFLVRRDDIMGLGE